MTKTNKIWVMAGISVGVLLFSSCCCLGSCFGLSKMDEGDAESAFNVAGQVGIVDPQMIAKLPCRMATSCCYDVRPRITSATAREVFDCENVDPQLALVSDSLHCATNPEITDLAMCNEIQTRGVNVFCNQVLHAYRAAAVENLGSAPASCGD